MGHAQALRQEQVELAAQAPAPVAEPGALVPDPVLEEALAGEVLEIRIVQPALPDALVGEPIGLLQQKDPNQSPVKNSEHVEFGRFRRLLK